MLERILDWLPIPTDTHIDRRIRNKRLRELKQYSCENNLGFYPVSVRNLPEFAQEVNAYIEQKARKDLPQSQFQESMRVGTIDHWAREMSDWVEIGGILGYNGSLYEMTYSPPKPTNMRLETNGIGANFTSSTRTKSFSREGLEKANAVIDWHTHPDGMGDPSKGDVKHISGAMEVLGDREIFFVIYRPLNNQVYWYKAQPLQKK